MYTLRVPTSSETRHGEGFQISRSVRSSDGAPAEKETYCAMYMECDRRARAPYK